MATMTFWLLVCILVTLNPSRAKAPKATSASMFQFLEGSTSEDDQAGWASHLLPTNFYSEINQQYYRRFRRHTALSTALGIGLRRWQQSSFEFARYVRE
ncbi:hypothetical protein KR018_000079 [Drosophila ironensis]|nr:hypothetical protein KR018_000079 [Drosophila ironensis]